MPFYWTCPKCGANNDSGERCDCGYRQIYSEEKAESLEEQLMEDDIPIEDD